MKLSRMSVLALALSGFMLAQQAQAHAHLKNSQPAAKSEVSVSPTQLTLNFTEDLEAKFSGVELKDSKGSVIKTDKATLSPDSKAELIIKLDSPLKTGSYEVDWHALSVDGHKTQGSYNFSVK